MDGEFLMSEVYLADIGNTHIHIYKDGTIKHYKHQDAIDIYKNDKIYFISVKQYLSLPSNWHDISQSLHINGEYEGMGVDRKALCLSHSSGIFVDAGSAITIDVVRDEVYQGGTILLGLSAMQQAYKDISKALDVELDRQINLTKLPFTTKEQISYGIIAPIKSLIEKHKKDLPLYITGGDGRFIASLFDDAIYDESLVFQGMKKYVKKV